MTDDELDLLVGQASPISDSRVAAFDLGSGELDLKEAIMSTTLETPTPLEPVAPRHHRRRRPLVTVGLVALSAAAASVIGLVAVGHNGPGGGSAYAAEAVAVAEANDRVLIRDWSVTRADEFSTDVGEMTFSDGEHEVELRWGPAADYPDFLADRSRPDDADQLGTVTVLGRPGHLFRYVGSQEYTTLVEPEGAHYLALRGALGSEAAYRDLFARLHTVDVDTWLDAMPASVVKPGSRAAAIDQMLVGIPLPAGFDRAELDASTSVNDRYQLGAKVTGAVVCGWFDQWFTATEQGDTAGATAASAALVSSHQWAILQEMASSGDWPRILWQYADATKGASADLKDGLTRASVASAFGCPASLSSPAPVPTTP